MDRRVGIYLNDIIKSIDEILSYVESVENYESFIQNDMVIDAVVRNLEIIGEIANKLPNELKEIHSNIPWREMYGLRNLAIHEYHIIDNRVIWEIATENIVQNKIDIEKVIENSNG